MDAQGRGSGDLAALVVPRVGRLRETGSRWEPWELVDPQGHVVDAVAAHFKDLLAADRSVGTLRSYGMDLLRWFRFLWAAEVEWDRATRADARDFMRWQQMTAKPRRGVAPDFFEGAAVNALTGKPVPSSKYAGTTRAHAETVLRGFYDFHLGQGTGPVLNPFPKVRTREGRPHAHHNPMQPFTKERVGLYRPKVQQLVPRSIPDDMFNELFLSLPSNRDRALVAFYVSTGARASELLGAAQGDVAPADQLITVVRKGSRVRQQLPASSDAFVWLRLYQEQMRRLAASGRRHPLWWTLKVPVRPLTYHAAYAMFRRVNLQLGTNWTLHDLRHTAAMRLAQDPEMPLTDVQWILGHAHLSSTQIYLRPRLSEVIDHT